ncbi:MAG: acetyltransferase [Candidatus Krumholzibacteria bacterium]|nr:acetyltransferase [Candidatus Krumholzibacteria bacterium]
MNDKVFIHPQAIVESENIGERTRIWAFAHVLKGAVIGRNCNICDFVFVENDVVIGDDVTVKCGVYIWDGLRIEDRVFVGPSVIFTNDHAPRSKAYQEQVPKTVIREGSSLGAGAVVLPGLVVGPSAMVGAGAVVTKDVKEYELVYGNPAKHRGFVCKCAKPLDFEGKKLAVCSCGLRYQFGDARVWQV